MTVYGYTRVSSPEQWKSGLGVAAGIDVIAAGCERHQWDLGPPREVEVDGQTFQCPQNIVCEPISAFRVNFRKREGGKWLWDNTVEGDIIVVPKLDRAFRNMDDTHETLRHFEKKGVLVVLLDVGDMGDSPMARIVYKMIVSVLAGLAEMESTRRSQRMKESHKMSALLSRPMCAVPPPCFRWLGTGRTRRLVYCDECCRPILDDVMELFEEQHETVEAIYFQFQRERRKRPHGGPKVHKQASEFFSQDEVHRWKWMGTVIYEMEAEGLDIADSVPEAIGRFRDLKQRTWGSRRAKT